MSDIYDFEPIYAALAALLINSATVTFSATGTGNVLTLAVGTDITQFSTGLAVQHQQLPIGTFIQSLDPLAGTLTLNQALLQPVAAPDNFTSGYASSDPTAARLLRHWSDVPQSEQPALFVAEVDEDATKRIGQPPKWTLDVKVYIYVMAPDDKTPAAPTLNALLRRLRIAMSRDKSGPGAVQNRQTLGGLVLDAYIQGKVIKDEGYLGQQAVAIVPILIQQNGP